MKKNIRSKNMILIDDNNTFSYLPNFEGIEFELDGKKYTTKLIAKHVINTIKIAIAIAQHL
jgi:hypothetical protein